MEANTFQTQARDAAQAVFTEALAQLAQAAVKPGLDTELAIKILNSVKDVAQAVPKDKGDGFANLPVFHIHMHNGRISGGAVTPALEVVDVGEAFQLTNAVPSDAMRAVASTINEELLKELEQ